VVTNVAQTELWPWLALAGLGAFHGLNPGMGWLFAVALGLHRKDRTIVYLSLLPIAAGHALAIAAAVLAFTSLGLVINARAVTAAAGTLLVGWAAYHWRYGHRHRVRIGMQTGLMGLLVWSFLMATAHGAGLMLWPALAPLCASAGMTAGADRLALALAAVGLHTATMLLITGAIALAVYEWIGVGVLRSAWINVDAIWMVALVLAGIVLLAG
jgi:hypothetical protein